MTSLISPGSLQASPAITSNEICLIEHSRHETFLFLQNSAFQQQRLSSLIFPFPSCLLSCSVPVTSPLREGVNNPSHGNCWLGGYPLPPPGPLRTTFSRKVNGKGGYPPPPLHGRSVTKNEIFFAENGVFCPKNTVFGPIFARFFLSGKGGYPPPPLSGRRLAKKLTEKS